MLVQVSVLGVYSPLGGTADLVLVVLISIALLRGSIFGAVAGFAAGLLIDTANLGTLGFTSLLLTLAGFWTGRYGETTARDRFHAPFTSVAVITVLYAFGTLALDFVLGQPAPAGAVPLRAAGDGAPEPDPDLAGLRLRAPALPAGRRRSTASTRCGSLASERSSAPLPARRPAGRGALPADAAARAAGRDPRLRRARRLRGALPAPLGAPGALGQQVPRGGERQPRADDPGRGAARDRSSTATGTCSSRTCSARASSSGRPTCRRAGRRGVHGARRALAGRRHARSRRSSAEIKPYANDPLTPVVLRRGIHSDQIDYLEEHQLEFPGVQLADSYLRSYPYKSLAAQVLGYVGPISQPPSSRRPSRRATSRRT